MLFDPDCERSTEEVIRRKWDHEWTEALKDRLLAIAEELGVTWYDVVVLCLDQFLRDLEDPDQGPAALAVLKMVQAPFGLDPRLMPPTTIP